MKTEKKESILTKKDVEDVLYDFFYTEEIWNEINNKWDPYKKQIITNPESYIMQNLNDYLRLNEYEYEYDNSLIKALSYSY